jgi:transcriptional regulator GlxA family with amidase domain
MSGYVPNRTAVAHPVGAIERIPGVSTQRPATVRLRTSLFNDAVEIVEQEYATDVSLDDIARRVASSRRQLQRAYAEIGDTTFREHLTRVRMQRAAELLARRNLTVREVARRVGYRQPAQFAKAFRRYQGQAPSAFRSMGARADRDLARAA